MFFDTHKRKKIKKKNAHTFKYLFSLNYKKADTMRNPVLLFAILILASSVVMAVNENPKAKALGHYMDAIKAYKSGNSNLTKVELLSAAGVANNPILSTYLEKMNAEYNRTGKLDSKLGKEIVYSFGLSGSSLDPNDPFNPNPTYKTPKDRAIAVIKAIIEMRKFRAS